MSRQMSIPTQYEEDSVSNGSTTVPNTPRTNSPGNDDAADTTYDEVGGLIGKMADTGLDSHPAHSLRRGMTMGESLRRLESLRASEGGKAGSVKDADTAMTDISDYLGGAGDSASSATDDGEATCNQSTSVQPSETGTRSKASSQSLFAGWSGLSGDTFSLDQTQWAEIGDLRREHAARFPSVRDRRKVIGDRSAPLPVRASSAGSSDVRSKTKKTLFKGFADGKEEYNSDQEDWADPSSPP